MYQLSLQSSLPKSSIQREINLDELPYDSIGQKRNCESKVFGAKKISTLFFTLVSIKSKASVDIANCHNICGEMLFSYECCQEKVG